MKFVTIILFYLVIGIIIDRIAIKVGSVFFKRKNKNR